MYKDPYILLLSKKHKESRLKIPRFLLNELIKDKALYKAVLLYLDLKPLFYSGVFLKAKSKSKSISAWLGISPRAYAYKIKLLKEKGFVRFNQSGDLILCSWGRFFANFGIHHKDPRKYKFYRLKNNYNLDLLSRVLITEENFQKQQKAILQKVFNQEILQTRQIEIIKNLQAINSDQKLPTKDKERLKAELMLKMKALELRKRTREQDAEFKKLKRNGVLEKLSLENYIQTDKQRRQTPNIKEAINYDISISCKRIGELFGVTSASGGHYWETVLDQSGYLQKIPRSIFIPGHTMTRLQWAEEIHHHYFDDRHRRGIFRRLNNHLQIKPLVKA